MANAVVQLNTMLKSFKEYLNEAAVAHAEGSYASLWPTEKSKHDIWEMVKKFNLPDPVDPEDYHCTVMYSRKAISDKNYSTTNVNIKAKLLNFRFLVHEDKTLVLELESPEISKLFESYKKLGATWDFPEYIPHISICTKIQDENIPLPKLLDGNFIIRFDKLVVEPLVIN